jgi:AcrR family transcriptional regulator
MVTKRDPEAARRRILDAAARAFAACGPQGARIDAIAAEADVNKRMLYHYFGAKDELFVAVLNDRFGADHALPDASTVVAGGLALNALDLRLMVWASIAGVDYESGRIENWRQLCDDLAGLQDQGQLRDDVEPQMLGLVLLAVSALLELLPATVRALAPELGQPWPQLGQLLGDVARPATGAQKAGAASGRTSPLRPLRPRVRMQPEVRGR